MDSSSLKWERWKGWSLVCEFSAPQLLPKPLSVSNLPLYLSMSLKLILQSRLSLFDDSYSPSQILVER